MRNLLLNWLMRWLHAYNQFVIYWSKSMNYWITKYDLGRQTHQPLSVTLKITFFYFASINRSFGLNRPCSSFATVIPAVAPVMTLQHVQCSPLPFLHPQHFLYPPLIRMNLVKVLALRSKIFLCAPQVSYIVVITMIAQSFQILTYFIKDHDQLLIRFLGIHIQ